VYGENGSRSHLKVWSKPLKKSRNYLSIYRSSQLTELQNVKYNVVYKFLSNWYLKYCHIWQSYC